MKTFGSTDMKEVKKSSVGKVIKPLINIFSELTADGVFPYGNLAKLKKMINNVTYEHKIEYSPLKLRKARKVKEKIEPIKKNVKRKVRRKKSKRKKK